MKQLRDERDTLVSLDLAGSLEDLLDEERARLHASLRRAEAEIAAGQAVPANVVLRELRAAS